MHSCFQQKKISGLVCVLSLPLPLSPSLPLAAGGPVIPPRCEWGPEAERRRCLRRPPAAAEAAAGSAGGTRRRTCTWTISTPTSGTSARSVASPAPCSAAFSLVSIWVVASRAGQRECAGRECGFRVVRWPVHRIQPLAVAGLESIVLLCFSVWAPGLGVNSSN